jgi:hypothetical protein
MINAPAMTSYMPMMMLEKEWLMSDPTPPAIATPPTALGVSAARLDEARQAVQA